MYEKELKRILDASQNQSLTFFVGAGVSALSGAPTWKDLIDAICDKLGLARKKDYSSDEYLQIPQMYYYSLADNKEEYYNFVEEQLHSTELPVNSIHRKMLDLNPVSYITTNYDTLLENTAVQYCQSFKVVSQDKDVPTILGDRFILKLHGDFKNKNFVLKEEDYLNYSENFKLIETLVKSIFSTNTVVFIGYGPNDYNIKLILNWTKALLKGNFREPIFLYTEKQVLTKEEIIYQQSKGLSVIEWSKLDSSADTYQKKYESFFLALNNQSKISLEGKTESEAFNILFERLQPLSHMNAIRISDISKRLNPYVRIDEDGIIHLSDDNNLLKRFFDINQMAELDKKSLEKEQIEKYNCILDTFRKARIFSVENNHTYRKFIDDVPFADSNCILFDYTAMRTFSAKTYKSLEFNYKKAFYLFRLKRYDEAFFLFSEVAAQAFKKKEYLLYYLAKANCISLHKVIDQINVFHRCYNIDAVKELSLNDTEIENLFRRLPVEFRNSYDCLADIHNVNLLYKYSYEAFIDGQKLQNTIESGAIEYGLTSSRKVICRINGYLHFLLGNGIVADIFLEYKSAVKNLMSMLVLKYANQEKQVLHNQPFPSDGGDKVYFDEIDFYCFIEHFDAAEIISLLNKNQIETIEFQNINLIETAVINLLNYYRIAVNDTKNNVDVIKLQLQIKTSLALLRYVSISQNLVDRICQFMLSQEFEKILIDDKIRFIDRQLARRKMYSKTTKKIIENTLINYLDKHITALKNNEKFEILSAHSDINYCNLVSYISPPEEMYYSRKLSARISQILSNNLSHLYSQITQYYFEYVSKNQKEMIVAWTKKQIRTKFSFELFTMLVQCNARIGKSIRVQLKEFLKLKIKDAKTKNGDNGIVVYPPEDPYEELNQVGYWCLINILKTQDFKEFLGNSSVFDFYCEYSKFDFSRFEVSWLLNLCHHALKQIAKDKKVKDNVRIALAGALKDNTIADSDSQRLNDILLKYFC